MIESVIIPGTLEKIEEITRNGISNDPNDDKLLNLPENPEWIAFFLPKKPSYGIISKVFKSPKLAEAGV